MKTHLILVLFLFSMFQSCKKTIGNKAYKANTAMTYKIDGRLVNIAGDLASIHKDGIGTIITYSVTNGAQGKFKVFSIRSQNGMEDAIQINLQTEQLEQKEYILKSGATIDPNNYFSMRTPTKVFGSAGDSSVVRVVITKISGISVYGTFSGIVAEEAGQHYDSQQGHYVYDYRYHQVTEGEFKEVIITD